MSDWYVVEKDIRNGKNKKRRERKKERRWNSVDDRFYSREILPILSICTSIYVINSLNEWINDRHQWMNTCMCRYVFRNYNIREKKSQLVCWCVYADWSSSYLIRCRVKLGTMFIETSHEVVRTWILAHIDTCISICIG